MMQRKYRIARLVYALVETVVTLVSFLLAYVIRDHLPLAYFGTLFPFRDYLGLLLVVVLLWNGLSLLIQNQPAASGADRLEWSRRRLCWSLWAVSSSAQPSFF